jgi:hypothetical protein
VDYRVNSEERSTNPVERAKPNLFNAYPNPANHQVVVHIETGKVNNETVLIHILRSDGTLWQEKRGTVAGRGDFVFDVQSLPQGVYLLQVRLESGEVETKRIAIVH